MMRRDMPKRELISIPSEGPAEPSPLRAVLVRPDQPASDPAPLVVLHRGVAFNDHDVDFLEALADAIAAAGMIAVHFETRATSLILDDFHAFTLEQATTDLIAVIAYGRTLAGVDADRIGLCAWCFGATAAVEAVRKSTAISRMCLLNAAPPSFIVARAAKAAAATTPVDAELYPRAMIERLSAMVQSGERLTPAAPTLIIHAAADRVVPAAVSEELTTAIVPGKPTAERLLIARADHSFLEPHGRAACIDRVVAWFAAMPSLAPRTTAAGASS